MQPPIAVIIPVRNGLAFLAGAIECVKSQSCSPLELVIIDDGSTVQVFKQRLDRLRRGRFDPNQPRRVPANGYLGFGSARQDEEAAS